MSGPSAVCVVDIEFILAFLHGFVNCNSDFPSHTSCDIETVVLSV